MASSYSFPLFKPEEIVPALHSYGIAPSPNLCAEDVVYPQSGFVAKVFSLFLANVVEYAPAAPPAPSCPVSPGSGLISAFACFGGHFACCSDEPDEQLQFQALQVLDNPEHHMRSLRLSRIYKRANAFLQSIQFRDLNLRDLLRADGPRVVLILSALINFLLFRREKLALLEPIVQEYDALDKRQRELRAKIDEVAFPSSSFTFFCLLSGEILRFSLPVCVFFSAFCSLPFSTLYSLARRKRTICLRSTWRHPWSSSSRRRSMPSSRGFMITTESSCRCAMHQKPWTKRERRH